MLFDQQDLERFAVDLVGALADAIESAAADGFPSAYPAEMALRTTAQGMRDYAEASPAELIRMAAEHAKKRAAGG